MGNKSQLDEIDEQIQLAFSNAKEKDNLERERALYAKQVERIHGLNTDLDGLAKKVSSLEVRVSRLKATVDNLFTVGLTEESKKMVRDQINDIFREKIAQLKKEADEEVKRVRKEGNRVAVPYSVLIVVVFTLFILLMFFGAMISANDSVFHSEWLSDCIWKTIWIWGGSVGLVVLGFYLYHRYSS